MKRLCTLVFSALLFTNSTIAQSLSGTVTDSASHQAISGAIISIPQLKLTATADAKGNYKISSLSNGTYDVEVTMLGYAPLFSQVTVMADARFDFAMAVSSTGIKEV